jgi:hypothetical protein
MDLELDVHEKSLDLAMRRKTLPKSIVAEESDSREQ